MEEPNYSEFSKNAPERDWRKFYTNHKKLESCYWGDQRKLDHIELLELIVECALFHEYWERVDPKREHPRMQMSGGATCTYLWIANWPTVPGDKLAEKIKAEARELAAYDKDKLAPNSMMLFLEWAIEVVKDAS